MHGDFQMPDHLLTRCELEVMDIVWKKERVTVQEVVDALDRSLAYTTVMTTMKILEKKKAVARHSKEGRAYVYAPVLSRREVGRRMAGDLKQRLFEGSLKSFVLSLVDGGSASKSEIRELKRIISELESDR
jgi:predicted transcriptional regulator